MNSVILSGLASFIKLFCQKFSESGIYRLFNRVYLFISRAWRDSSVIGFLKRPTGVKARESLIYRIFHIPFGICERINKKYSKRLAAAIEKSIILEWGRTYMQNCFALNTRFLGTWMIAAFVGRAVMYPFAGFSRLTLLMAIVGAVLVIGNFNIMRFLDHSVVVRFVLNALGFKDVKLDFYDEAATVKRSRIVMAAAVGLCSGVIMSANALYGLALPVLIGGAAAVAYNPLVGVFAAAAAAPFVPTMVLAGLCILTALSLIIHSLYERKFVWRLDGVGIGLIVMLVILFVSSVFSFSPVSSLTVWAMYLVFVGFYFVITNTVRTRSVLYSLMRVFVLFAALVALYGIMQYVFGWTTSNAWIDEEMFEDSTMRVYSTMGNPNVLGEFLLIAMPLAAVFMLHDAKNTLSKYVNIAIFLVMALCLVLTQSRGCWLGFMLTAMVFVTFYKGRLWGLAPLALVALAFVIPETMIDRLMSIGNMDDTSTSYRVFIWLGTLDMMRDFWLGGIGMGEGAFKCVYPIYSYNAIVAPHSHNTFLQLLVEGGITCVATFIVTMVVFIKKLAVRFGEHKKNSLVSISSLAILSGTLGFLLQSMFDYTFYNYRMMAMFFMFVAFGSCLCMGRKGSRNE